MSYAAGGRTVRKTFCIVAASAMLAMLVAGTANARDQCDDKVEVAAWQYNRYGQPPIDGPGRFSNTFGAESEEDLQHLCQEFLPERCRAEYDSILDAIADEPELRRAALDEFLACKEQAADECHRAGQQICTEADRAEQAAGNAPYAEMVARAQRLLSQLGYDPGPIDGIFGDRTLEAVQRFHRRHPTKSGYINLNSLERETLTLLERVAARQTGAATVPDANNQDTGELQVTEDSHFGHGGYIGQGPIIDGQPHGYWTLKHPDGAISEGPMVDGRPHGKWTHRHPDGYEETGLMMAGEMGGRWTVRYPDGTVAEGPYVDWKEHGRWTIRLANGNVAEGPYVDGTRHGRWTIRSANGNVAEGPYVDGTRHGRWTIRSANGDVQEGPYVDRKKHGRWTERFANGNVQEGPYVDGKRHGRWTKRHLDRSTSVYRFEHGELMDNERLSP
jgi:antitoxin component YwqK of YwqJK toxin-antitoxin module